MTPSVIEPATFRFVAQHLNHCANLPQSLYFQNAVKKLCRILRKRPPKVYKSGKMEVLWLSAKTLVRDGNCQEFILVNSQAIRGLFYVECSIGAKYRPLSLFNFKTFSNIVAIPWTLLSVIKKFKVCCTGLPYFAFLSHLNSVYSVRSLTFSHHASYI